MKKYILIISLCILCACNDTFSPNYNDYSLTVKLLIPSAAVEEIDSMPPLTVHITNKHKDYTLSTESDNNGFVTFPKLEAGIYTLGISETFEGEIINTTLNGYAELTVNENKNDSLQMTHVFTQVAGGGFIIREYYYGGTLTPAGNTYLDDQYVEIYNNGPDTLYADSVVLVELESYATSPDYWSYMHEDSFVVKTIWGPPTITGHDFPVAPGKGYIMARDPMNHKSDPNGNPNSPVDLGNADFDMWSDKMPNADIDFPAPNLIPHLWVYKGTDMVFHLQGGSAIAIVKIPGDIDEYINQNLITQANPNTSSKYFCKIANTYTLDAVEATWRDDRKTNKRIPSSLDAGITYLEEGAKLGLCVRRKVKYSINGRIIYQDTNNSTEDFLHDVSPEPGVYE